MQERIVEVEKLVELVAYFEESGATEARQQDQETWESRSQARQYAVVPSEGEAVAQQGGVRPT